MCLKGIAVGIEKCVNSIIKSLFPRIWLLSTSKYPVSVIMIEKQTISKPSNFTHCFIFFTVLFWIFMHL